MSDAQSNQSINQRPPELPNPSEVLDVLGDETNRRILGAIDEERSAIELADELDVPTSTTYRKVSELDRIGLLEQTNPGVPPDVAARYRCTVESLIVQFREHVDVDVLTADPEWR